MAGAVHPTSSPQQNSAGQIRTPRQSLGGASTCRVKSRALAHKARVIQPPNISRLSSQLGNANTQHFSQTIGGIKGRCDCAANVIYSEPQIPSSAPFFLSLEYKQPDLFFIPSTSLRQDSCLLSWLDASNKAGNFMLVIPMWRGCSRGGGQRSQAEDEALFWKTAASQGPAPEVSCISGALQRFGAVSWC